MADEVSPVEADTFIGMANLMRRIRQGEDLTRLVNLSSFNPNSANLMMGHSIVFQLTGSRDTGLLMQSRALRLQQLYHERRALTPHGLRLLAILRPGDLMDNTPVDFLIDGMDVALDILYVGADLPWPEALPEHDVLMVCIAESAENLPLLEKLEERVKSCPVVINRPGRIKNLSRDGVSARLAGIPELVMPRYARVSREGLEQLARGEVQAESLVDGNFPLIVRPVGSQAGMGLAKLESPGDIANYLDAVPDANLYIARFADYRGEDGQFRKCRIALIDGVPYACHLAISDNWMIHYKNAGMEENADKRAEEARFMEHFDAEFGARHAAAFRAVAERLGMDYLVVDCAETRDKNLLVFEADNIGFIHAMDPEDVYPYKGPQMQKVFSAFHTMLRSRARAACSKC